MHIPWRKSSGIQQTYVGKVDFVSPHHAFIIVEGLEKDISVAYGNTNGAMHGDLVKVSILSSPKRGRMEGKVVDIMKRSYDRVIGCVVGYENEKVVMPDHKRLHQRIRLVKEGAYGKVKLHDKVVVKITKYPTQKAWAVGKISEILGARGSHEAEEGAIIEEYGLDKTFSKDIEKAVAAFPDELSHEEIARRRDFTAVPTFTIDPDDAKDFDDALSVKKLPDGNYQIGIHIADVGHYVKKNTVIDEEALKRGTSVYLVGTCIPMLPERLSNDLCSLKPHTKRPAFSVVVTLDESAKVEDIWVGETLIYSDRRFTYQEAQEVIERKKGDFATEIGWLHQLARKLRKRRLDEGAIAFESSDLHIELDKQKNPVRIVPKIASQANKLVEEFMLLANRLVAEKIYRKKQGKNHATFIYRTHDKPEAGKLEDFATYLKQLGYNFKPTVSNLDQAFNKILKEVANTPHQNIVQMLAIRTMAQALYTVDPKPHFGLAYPHYTHFTSPIRRYPDLVVHRLVKDYLNSQPAPDKRWYEEMTAHTSSRERIAIEAERTSINGKQVVFMKKLEGNTYQGVISGITTWGIYVEILENKCEGMVKVSDLKDDYYEIDQRKFCLMGKRTQKVYKLGDLVRVKIKYCDLDRRTTDLVFVTR
ncbi:MAG: ribonuclease R [Bacteroidota bacterium]